jgi:tripartite-type tricarboxylate transporter receptor subunit TctC
MAANVREPTMSAFIKRARVWCLAIAIGLIVVPIRASAQSNFPTRTIRIVVPIPPGPVADALPRMVAERLAQRWGQPVIVENRPGGALNIGAEAVARAQPDGHTLLATPPGPLVISQHFYPKLGFDPTAFVPISILASLPFVLIASPTSPPSTLTELVAYAKANPNKVTYASSGVGSAPHLAAEMLAIAAGIRMVHIPYKGTAPAMIDLRAGHVDLLIDNLSNALAQFTDGKVKILGVGSEQRLAQLPNVPAISEILPGYTVATWFAVVAPPKTPPDIAAKLSSGIAEVLRSPDMAKKLDDLHLKPVAGSPAETAAFLKQESDRWRNVIQRAGIKLE